MENHSKQIIQHIVYAITLVGIGVILTHFGAGIFHGDKHHDMSSMAHSSIKTDVQLSREKLLNTFDASDKNNDKLLSYEELHNFHNSLLK